MAYSFVKYTGNGADLIWSVTFPYLDKSHVVVTVDGEPGAYTWLSSTAIKFVSAPASDAKILIQRQTPIDQRMVNFVDAALLTEGILDLDSNQLFYVAQERSDWDTGAVSITPSGDYDAHGTRVANVGEPVLSGDGANKGYVETAAGDAEDFATAAAENSEQVSSDYIEAIRDSLLALIG